MRRLLIAVCVVAAAACGSSLRKDQARRLAEADTLFMRGCYSCLRQSFDAYDSLRQAGYQPALTGAKAFDAAILLAAREKELAMEANGWIARAEALKSHAGSHGPVYLAILASLPYAAGRFDVGTGVATGTTEPVLDALDRWNVTLGPAPARNLVATYLMAAAQCAHLPFRAGTQPLTAERLAPAHASTPLIKYVVGSCHWDLRSHLEGLANDPDFHEATFQMGRLRLYQGGPTVHTDARVLLEAARAAMPEAIASTYLLAGVLSALQEFEACADAYDEVVKRGGTPRQSRLSRTICLTHAVKRAEAIRSATELIDTPGILRGEGYFWRAWNLYHSKQLPPARTDVEESKKLYKEPDVFALSGFIAYDQDQKDYAYTEFGEAFTRSNSNYCVAAFYQGLIDSQKERWPPAAGRYEQATFCYSRSVRQIERELQAVEALDPAEHPTREKRLENLKVGLDAEKLQLARAAYNAAYSHGKSGNEAKGIPFAQQAATAHKDMEKLANELLEILRKSG